MSLQWNDQKHNFMVLHSSATPFFRQYLLSDHHFDDNCTYSSQIQSLYNISRYTKVKFEFWFRSNDFDRVMSPNWTWETKKFSVSALLLPMGFLYVVKIAHTNILSKNTGQVWIWSRSDNFWQRYALELYKKKI